MNAIGPLGTLAIWNEKARLALGTSPFCAEILGLNTQSRTAVRAGYGESVSESGHFQTGRDFEGIDR